MKGKLIWLVVGLAIAAALQAIGELDPTLAEQLRGALRRGLEGLPVLPPLGW